MRRAVCLAIAALASCGDNELPAAPGDAAPGCTVAFSGNFVETAGGPSVCPEASSGALHFAIASTTLGATVAIVVALGTAIAPGTYSPAVVQEWSASGTNSHDSGCVYAAGSAIVPNGSFALTIDSADPLHGSLVIDAYVHALEFTRCGTEPIERIGLAF